MKANFVIFHSYQKRLDYEVKLKIYDYQIDRLISIERKSYVKYLGVLMDSNLCWKYHITSSVTLLNVYRSLISPSISYGLIAWGQAAKTQSKQDITSSKTGCPFDEFCKV